MVTGRVRLNMSSTTLVLRPDTLGEQISTVLRTPVPANVTNSEQCPPWMIILGFGYILHNSVHVNVKLDKRAQSNAYGQHNMVTWMLYGKC